MKRFTVVSLFLLSSVLANSQDFKLHPKLSEPPKKLSLTEQVNQIKKTHLPLNYKKKSLRSLTSPSALDSTYYFSWDTVTNIFRGLLGKTINTYDSNNRITSSTSKIPSGSTWEVGGHELFTYDINGNKTSDIVQGWDTISNTWKDAVQYLYTYDLSGNQLSVIINEWNDSGYEMVRQFGSYTYDENNNRLTSNVQFWDTATSEYKNTFLSNYSYDSNNNLIAQAEHYWNGTEYINTELITATYDLNNNLLTGLEQFWDSTTYVNSTYYTASYDTSNNNIESIEQRWSGSGWINTSKDTNTYDIHNNLITRLIESYEGFFAPSFQNEIYSYDSNNNNIEVLYQYRGSLDSTWYDQEKGIWTYDAHNNMLASSWQSMGISGWVNDGDDIYTYDINNDQTSFTRKAPDGENIDSTYNFFSIKSMVWPGDANNDLIVDNTDLLPIGLYYSDSGIPRSFISNVWQADTCANWGTAQPNGSDIKHADCNGDGVIDANDTLAISTNFTLTHTMIAAPAGDERSSGPDIYIVTSGSAYSPGDWVNAEIWLGSAVAPVSDLYGIAFNINYNGAFVQTGTGSIDYTSSWLGTPGTNAIKVSLIDPASSIAYAAETRIDHTNASGYGKIATFRFQVKNTSTTADSMNLNISGYTAVDASGSLLTFNPVPLVIGINTGIHEIENENGIRVFPNPYTDYANINYTLNKNADVRIQIYNTVGQNIETLVNTKQSAGEYKYIFSAKEKGYDAGVYYVKITIDGKCTMKKIIEMK